MNAETFNPDYVSSAESIDHLHMELLDKAHELKWPLMVIWHPAGTSRTVYFTAKMVDGWPAFWENGRYNNLFSHLWAYYFAMDKQDYPLAAAVIEETARDMGTTWNSAELLLSELVGAL